MVWWPYCQRHARLPLGATLTPNGGRWSVQRKFSDARDMHPQTCFDSGKRLSDINPFNFAITLRGTRLENPYYYQSQYTANPSLIETELETGPPARAHIKWVKLEFRRRDTRAPSKPSFSLSRYKSLYKPLRNGTWAESTGSSQRSSVITLAMQKFLCFSRD